MTSEYDLYDFYDWPSNWKYESDDAEQIEADQAGEIAEELFKRNYRKPRRVIIKKKPPS